MAAELPMSRIVPLVAHAVAVFGDERKAAHWLATPLALFQDRAPSELLETDEGIALVEETLKRMERKTGC